MTVPGDCSGRVSAIRVARLAQTNAIFRRPTVPDGRGVKFILSLLSRSHRPGAQTDLRPSISAFRAVLATLPPMAQRSEERRVGKEGVSTGRSRWWRYHEKKN